MSQPLRHGMLVTVPAYGTHHDGIIVPDQPQARQLDAGRTVAVRLNTGQLRFYHPDDIHPR